MDLPQSAPAPVSDWRRTAATGLNVLAIGLLLVTIAACLGRYWWRFEQLSHFRVQYVAASLAFVVGAVAFKARWALAAGIVCGLFHAAVVAPCYIPRERSAEAGPPFRILIANAYVGNTQYGKLFDLIREERPDLLVVSELSEGWLDALAALKEEYPYSEARAEGIHGIGIYSRSPLTDSRIESLGAREWPSAMATVTVHGQPIVVVAAHPPPPANRSLAALRNERLAELARFVAESRLPVIVAGDLNVSPWSVYFDDFLKQSGLEDSRRGFGIQATWPADAAVLRIPIDHCLVSNEIEVHSRRVGQEIGSDHFPVIVDVSIKQE